ncbi:MAG: AraC family transcriptional regulator [Clostridia bacterium]|nr:AraC family transcriptional regulator [Clostridia bacterium]
MFGRENDIHVLWSSSCKYLPGSRVDEHTHDFFHYLYILKGQGEIHIGNETHIIHPNEIYLIPPNTVHGFYNSSETSKLLCAEIKFDVHAPEYRRTVLELPNVLSVKNTPISRILMDIYKETRVKDHMSETISVLLMQELFAYLLRAATGGMEDAKPAPKQETTKSGDDLSRVLDYIFENVQNNITLQDLANICCLEKTYFLKKFKTLTGYTPMAYVRKEKIKKAKELLIYSDMNITQISEAVGFESIHHFSNVFSKATGMSPNKFKKEHMLEN